MPPLPEPRYARVIVDRSIHRELDYLVPETLGERVAIGSRVRVPFRERSALATVVALLDETSAEGIRPIEALVGDRPALSAKLVELARWMSAYYCCPIETVMRSLLPQVIRKAEIGWKKQLFVSAAKEILPEDIEKLRFNRCIAHIYECANGLSDAIGNVGGNGGLTVCRRGGIHAAGSPAASGSSRHQRRRPRSPCGRIPRVARVSIRGCTTTVRRPQPNASHLRL